MSVINKMLRDLDRQQTTTPPVAGASQPPRASGAGLTHGTSAVHNSALPSGMRGPGERTRRWVAPIALTLLLLLAVVWGLRLWLAPVALPEPARPLPLPTAPVLADAQAIPKIVAIDQDSKGATAIKGVQELSQPVLKAEPAARVNTPVSVPVAKDTGVRLAPTRQGAGLKESTELKTFNPAVRPASGGKVAPTPQVASDPALSEQQAALNVVAQAQAHWSEGDRAGSVALLQGAISRLEGSSGAPTALATLAREYVRMTQAQGRPQDALNLLVRLEQRLAGVADIWALRGQVAQRLGLHPQAVHAYLRALELQPDEPRWMLAVAVSLAAQGQTGSAAEFADKARRAGFLQPDVANYLRQLGVALHTD